MLTGNVTIKSNMVYCKLLCAFAFKAQDDLEKGGIPIWNVKETGVSRVLRANGKSAAPGLQALCCVSWLR